MSNDNLSPMGHCPTCRMALIKIDGERKCPSCSSISINPTPLINNIEDPGEEGLAKIMSGMSVTPRLTQSKETETRFLGTTRLTSADPFSQIDASLKEAKFETMDQAKKILKLRKKLNDLKFEVETFLGGN